MFYNNSVLLQLRDNNKNITAPNVWAYLGGGVEQGETYKQAAIREFFEECEYKIDPKKLYKFVGGKMIFENNMSYSVVYITKYNGKSAIKCNEGQKIEFINLNDFKKIENTLPLVKFVVTEGYKVFKALDAKGKFN